MSTRKKYLIIGGLLAGFLIILSLLINATSNGTLEITAPNTQNSSEVLVKITDEKGAAVDLRMVPGSTSILSLKTGTHRVNSSADNIKAVDIVKISAGSTTRLTLKFATQLTATKVGTDAEFCPTMIENVVYSYNCTGDGFIFRHPGAGDRKIPVLDSHYFGQLKTYNTGFLGFPITNPADSSRDNLALSFVDMKAQTIQKVSLPGTIPTSKLSDNLTIITPTDPSKTFFALVVRDQSKIYLFKNTTDQSPVVFSLPTDKTFIGGGNAPALSFDGDTLIAYMGKSVTGEEHDGQEDNEGATPHDGSVAAKADGKIYEYTLEGKLSRTLSVPDDFWAESIVRLTNDYFATTNVRGTEVYFQRDNKLERIYRLGDAVNAVSAKGELYMVLDNGVFLFSPQQDGLFALSNAYNDSAIRVSDIYDSQNAVMFTGFDSDEARAKLQIFTLKK
jgi:hypothetical protein